MRRRCEPCRLCAMGFLLILGFLVPLAWSQPDCPGDGSSHLQSHRGAVQAGAQGNASLDRVDPCLADINTGVCISTSSTAACVECQGGAIIPSIAAGFLLCNNNVNRFDGVCQSAFGAPPYTFADASNFLDCTGSAACRDFGVENVGAVCCSGQNACRDSGLGLAASVCTNDICCDGNSACRDSSFQAVNRMSCSGIRACEDTQVELKGGLSKNLVG